MVSQPEYNNLAGTDNRYLIMLLQKATGRMEIMLSISNIYDALSEAQYILFEITKKYKCQ